MLHWQPHRVKRLSRLLPTYSSTRPVCLVFMSAKALCSLANLEDLVSAIRLDRLASPSWCLLYLCLHCTSSWRSAHDRSLGIFLKTLLGLGYRPARLVLVCLHLIASGVYRDLQNGPYPLELADHSSRLGSTMFALEYDARHHFGHT